MFTKDEVATIARQVWDNPARHADESYEADVAVKALARAMENTWRRRKFGGCLGLITDDMNPSKIQRENWKSIASSVIRKAIISHLKSNE